MFTTFFATVDDCVSMDSMVWEILEAGAVITLLLITCFPNQWFKVNPWTAEI